MPTCTQGDTGEQAGVRQATTAKEWGGATCLMEWQKLAPEPTERGELELDSTPLLWPLFLCPWRWLNKRWSINIFWWLPKKKCIRARDWFSGKRKLTGKVPGASGEKHGRNWGSEEPLGYRACSTWQRGTEMWQRLPQQINRNMTLTKYSTFKKHHPILFLGFFHLHLGHTWKNTLKVS